jgi:hypothetical protein
MDSINLMPGAVLQTGPKGSVLFGSPPEIIKLLIAQNLPFPETIVLSDTLEYHGILQHSTEFPLYHFLFSLGRFFKGEKLTIIGTAEAVKYNRELLRITLLGPSKEEYEALGPSPYHAQLYRESRHLSLKDKTGREVPIEELVDFRAFEDGEIETPLGSLRRLDVNTYRLGDSEVRIPYDGMQVPPYALNVGFLPNPPLRFGLDVVGGGSGFTSAKPCSCLLLNHSSDYMLIDALPYLDSQLKSRGLSLNQISSVFMSHIHDDHCNVFPFVLNNHCVDFISTREIYWMTRYKLACQIHRSVDEMGEYFNFIELEPYQVNSYYGLEITPHYSVHSIPTVGAEFALRFSSRRYSIGFSADNKSLADIRTMAQDGQVDERKSQYLHDFYRRPFDILVADGGKGLLHGEPRDALKSPSSRIVFLHLDNLDPEFDASFSAAKSGKRYSLVPDNRHNHAIFMTRLLERCFPGLRYRWVNALLSDMNIRHFNSEDIIMRQGESKSDVISVVLSGRCAVLYHDGHSLHKVAEKQVGDILGELAVVKGHAVRTASITAETPVVICELDDSRYLSFLKADKRYESFRDVLLERFTLERIYPFSKFSDPVKDTVCKMGKFITVSPGDVLDMDEKYVYFHLSENGNPAPGAMTEMPGRMYCAELHGGEVRLEGGGRFVAISSQDLHLLRQTIPCLNYYLHGQETGTLRN